MAVEMNGRGSSLFARRYAWIARMSSGTLPKVPPRMRLRVISANQRSIRLSQDVLVGVKCRWYRGEPGLDRRMLVGGAVVQDQVDLAPPWGAALDAPQEADEPDVPTARLAAADHGATEHIERREEGGRAVTQVVVGLALGDARRQR